MRCCCISFVQFFLYGVGEGGVLLNTHENHGAIAVFREKDRLIVLQDSFFDLFLRSETGRIVIIESTSLYQHFIITLS